MEIHWISSFLLYLLVLQTYSKYFVFPCHIRDSNKTKILIISQLRFFDVKNILIDLLLKSLNK